MKTISPETRTFTVAYNCVYCGRKMYHSSETQPSTTYAQCWKCWGERIVKDREGLRKRLNRAEAWMPIIGIVAFGLGVAVGLTT